MIKVLKQTVKALELVSTEFVCNGAHHAKKDRHELGESCPIVEHYEEAIQAGKQAIAELESQECNFCSRCGKRTADLTTIHTCTPPRGQA